MTKKLSSFKLKLQSFNSFIKNIIDFIHVNKNSRIIIILTK